MVLYLFVCCVRFFLFFTTSLFLSIYLSLVLTLSLARSINAPTTILAWMDYCTLCEDRVTLVKRGLERIASDAVFKSRSCWKCIAGHGMATWICAVWKHILLQFYRRKSQENCFSVYLHVAWFDRSFLELYGLLWAFFWYGLWQKDKWNSKAI